MIDKFVCESLVPTSNLPQVTADSSRQGWGSCQQLSHRLGKMSYSKLMTIKLSRLLSKTKVVSLFEKEN